MNTRSVLWIGGIALGAYLLYRWGKQTIASAVPNLQPAGNPALARANQPGLLNAVSAGLAAGINAGTYNAQTLRMQPEGAVTYDQTGMPVVMWEPTHFGPGQTGIAGWS